MRDRRAKTTVNRRAHHLRRLQLAGTDRDRLWAACAWLVAEAVRASRAAEATRAVLQLVHALPDGQPVTVREVGSGPDPSPTPAPGP